MLKKFSFMLSLAACLLIIACGPKSTEKTGASNDVDKEQLKQEVKEELRAEMEAEKRAQMEADAKSSSVIAPNPNATKPAKPAIVVDANDIKASQEALLGPWEWEETRRIIPGAPPMVETPARVRKGKIVVFGPKHCDMYVSYQGNEQKSDSYQYELVSNPEHGLFIRFWKEDGSPVLLMEDGPITIFGAKMTIKGGYDGDGGDSTFRKKE